MDRYRLTLVYDFEATDDAEAEAASTMAARLAEPLVGRPVALLAKAPRDRDDQDRWISIVDVKTRPKSPTPEHPGHPDGDYSKPCGSDYCQCAQ